MPDKKTIEKAKEDRKEGKAASTQAGEFVKAEMDEMRKGNKRVRSTKQAIAIGLSEARRAGVPVKPAAKGKTSEKTLKKARTKGPVKRSAAAKKAARTRGKGKK
jgi:hypothetical protein